MTDSRHASGVIVTTNMTFVKLSIVIDMKKLNWSLRDELLGR